MAAALEKISDPGLRNALARLSKTVRAKPGTLLPPAAPSDDFYRRHTPEEIGRALVRAKAITGEKD